MIKNTGGDTSVSPPQIFIKTNCHSEERIKNCHCEGIESGSPTRPACWGEDERRNEVKAYQPDMPTEYSR